MSESAIQSSIMLFLDQALPTTYRAFAVPNGGKRDRITGAILKREGVKAGVPDIAIIGAGGTCALIEVKTAKGRLSENQIRFRDWCGQHGVPFAVCRSVGDVQSFLADLNITLKARLAA